MSQQPDRSQSERIIDLVADQEPVDVVFEMRGRTVTIAPRGRLRLVTKGPASAGLTVGLGTNGLSIFRDEGLAVLVLDENGDQVDIGIF